MHEFSIEIADVMRSQLQNHDNKDFMHKIREL